MLTNKVYGGGNAPISHMFTFMYFNSRSERKPPYMYEKIWAQEMESFYSCVNENDNKGFATQATLTDGQIQADPIYLDMLEETGFVKVFTHTNPNTQRIIHTFMKAPPKSENPQQKLPNNFYEGFYNRPDRLTDEYRSFRQRAKGLTTYHGGGCCGWGHFWGIDPSSNEFIPHLFNCMGISQYASKGLGWQFCLPTQHLIWERDYTDYSSVRYFISTAGFREIFSFYGGKENIPWSLFAKSSNEITK